MKSGDVIGRYCLTSRVGRGGMGEVWLATASGYGGFNKTVVVKTLLPEFASDPLFVEMLAHEARICATLSHPNLIEVFDFIKHEDIYLLAMEHVVGRPLNHILRAAQERGEGLPAWFALRVAWECCRGLECAHSQGIIHCDLSPSNVMMTFAGVTKVLDFGVAHATANGRKPDRLKGKFAYMAPERIRSLATDQRTDVYAMGVLLYLMFAGRLPFEAESEAALMHKIVTERPPPPSHYAKIDPAIERIILRAIQRDPDARHQTVTEMLVEISACLEGQLGTYGQQDAAAYLKSLFDGPAPIAAPRPGSRSGVAEEERASDEGLTQPPDASAVPEIEFDDIEVVLDESEPASVAEVEAPSHRAPSSLSERRSPVRPLTGVFDSPSFVRETRTSVKTLFGERPSSVGRARTVFDRVTPVPSAPVPSPPATPEATRGNKPEQPAQAVPERSRGVFEGYEPQRRREPASAWPWPTSKTKP